MRFLPVVVSAASSVARRSRAAVPLAARAAAVAGILTAAPVLAQDVSPDADAEPFLVFDQSHPLLPPSATPMVQVFESGRAIITRAPGRSRPGVREVMLDAATLARLRTLAESGAGGRVPTEAEPVRSMVDGREVLTVVHDPVTTTIRLRRANDPNGIAVAGDVPDGTQVIEVVDLAGRGEAPVLDSGVRSLVALERSMLELFAGAPGEDR